MKLADAQAQGKLSLLDQAQVLTFQRFLEAAGERGSLQEPIELPPDLYNWALGRDAVPNLTALTWPGHEGKWSDFAGILERWMGRRGD